VSEEAQVSVSVRRFGEITARVLLGQLSAFRELQSLHLPEACAVGDLDMRFLADVSRQHGSTLRHLRIDNLIYFVDDGNNEGYEGCEDDDFPAGVIWKLSSLAAPDSGPSIFTSLTCPSTCPKTSPRCSSSGPSLSTV